LIWRKHFDDVTILEKGGGIPPLSSRPCRWLLQLNSS